MLSFFKTRYCLILTPPIKYKINFIKAYRKITGMSLKDSKSIMDYMERTPNQRYDLLGDLSKKEATEYVQLFRFYKVTEVKMEKEN